MNQFLFTFNVQCPQVLHLSLTLSLFCCTSRVQRQNRGYNSFLSFSHLSHQFLTRYYLNISQGYLFLKCQHSQAIAWAIKIGCEFTSIWFCSLQILKNSTDLFKCRNNVILKIKMSVWLFMIYSTKCEPFIIPSIIRSYLYFQPHLKLFSASKFTCICNSSTSLPSSLIVLLHIFKGAKMLLYYEGFLTQPNSQMPPLIYKPIRY